MRTNLQLSNVITINLRELHFHSKEQAEDKSCIVVTIFNAACTLGEEDGGNRKHYHTTCRLQKYAKEYIFLFKLESFCTLFNVQEMLSKDRLLCLFQTRPFLCHMRWKFDSYNKNAR